MVAVGETVEPIHWPPDLKARARLLSSVAKVRRARRAARRSFRVKAGATMPVR